MYDRKQQWFDWVPRYPPDHPAKTVPVVPHWRRPPRSYCPGPRFIVVPDASDADGHRAQIPDPSQN